MTGMPRIPGMSERDARALVVGIALCGGLFLAARLISHSAAASPVVSVAGVQSSNDPQRIQALVAARPVMRRAFDERGARFLKLAVSVPHGDTPAMAAASLGSIVSSAAAVAGVKLGTLELTADSATRGILTRVSVRAQAEGDIRGITRFLGVLEGGAGLVAVRELSITQSAVDAPDDQPETLRMSITVQSPARVRETPKKVPSR